MFLLTLLALYEKGDEKMEKIILTKDGVKKLEAEYRHLIDVERPEVIEQLTFARAQGDLSENADYDAARTRQAEVEGRIREIENILNNAKIVDAAPKNSKVVTLGSYVEVRNLRNNNTTKYKIVGTVEANPLANPPQISNVSPVGEALIGRRVNDVVTIKTSNPYDVEIIKIDLNA